MPSIKSQPNCQRTNSPQRGNTQIFASVETECNMLRAVRAEKVHQRLNSSKTGYQSGPQSTTIVELSRGIYRVSDCFTIPKFWNSVAISEGVSEIRLKRHLKLSNFSSGHEYIAIVRELKPHYQIFEKNSASVWWADRLNPIL